MFFLRVFSSFFSFFLFFVMGGFRKFGNHMQLFLSIPSRCDRRCVPVKQNGCEIRFVLFVIFFVISSNLITTTTLRGGVTHFFSLSPALAPIAVFICSSVMTCRQTCTCALIYCAMFKRDSGVFCD